jgi:hypothetical protein
MGARLPMQTLIALACERFAVLAAPEGETSPFISGGTPAQWADAAGLDCMPSQLIIRYFPRQIDLDGHAPETVAHAALQALAHRAIVEGIPGLPHRYRPRRRG